MRGHLKHFCIGLLMGSADVVPGVSGGTVALVCGIYVRLIDAIRGGSRVLGRLLRGHASDGIRGIREVDLRLLVPTLAGIAAAVLALASAIEHLLEDEPVKLAGLFLGLVAGSVVVARRLLRQPDRTQLVIVLVTAAATFVALGLRADTTAEAAEAASAPLWAFPAAGAAAICAMILPGVSGSFLLVMLGMYSEVLGAVNERNLPVILLFVAGCVAGLALFSTFLAWLLDRHHDRIVALMIGLMLGSVRVLWPWPGGISTTELGIPSGDVAAPLALMVGGSLVVLALGRLGVLSEESVPPARNR